MEQPCPSPDTTHQQEATDAPSVLRRLADRASKFSINLNGDIRRTLGGPYRPVRRGGTAIVCHGIWIPHGTEVAIKTFYNALSESEDDLKRLFREVHKWSKLRHENIVPMFGISTELDSTLSIISEWMPLGNAHDYVQNRENDPRPLLEDVARGLCYLHSHELGPIVHGALKGSDVLVSSDRRALLTDFGFSTLNISTFSMTVDAESGIALYWVSPELLEGDAASTASDVWAFGMTVLELFTRAVPYSDCQARPTHVLTRIMFGKLPDRPCAETTQSRMTDAWWGICESCWRRDPSSRPTMRDIVDEVRAVLGQAGPASTHPKASGSAYPISREGRSHPTRATLLPLRTRPVEQDCHFPRSTRQQPVMELFSVLHELCNWASTYELVLDGQVSRNLGRNPLHGSIAIVHQGTLARSGTEVAIKAFYRTLSGTEAELKRMFREVYLCSKLHHKNIVLSIISEWMPLGSAHAYVQNTLNDPRPLFRDIANGLYYLHSHELGPVVHGDLKGVNVLVSNDRRALLTDFGLSTLNASTFSTAVDIGRGGTPHWMAPELLDGCPVSMESDVWAFGMTILELFTREPPFRDCRREAVFYKLMQGKLPPRPSEDSTRSRLTNAWWRICTLCWAYIPSSRPTMKDIIEEVEVAIRQPTSTKLW
ncbi:kinase-like domain-containing protein [Pisolithus croceorrhizus]|nr:kinase-like domain-containing protein [Pisolithus croceorrhizus]KAI6106978.1 kinase-like domain-containing protein [Pisolithus croceorrhizus]